MIADLYRGGTGNIRDARLIAAAPELLEALRMWLDIHETPAGFAGKYGKALDDALAAQQLKVDAAASAARAAIAKATGRFGMTTQPTPMEGRATGLLQALRSIAAITTCADQDPEAMCAEIQGICRVALAALEPGERA